MTRFAELLERAADGEQFGISQAGKPVAKLIDFRINDYDRAAGQWNGIVQDQQLGERAAPFAAKGK